MKRTMAIAVLLIVVTTIVVIDSCSSPDIRVVETVSVNDLPLHEQIVCVAYSTVVLKGKESILKTHALIDDVAGGAKSGYKLVEIDGGDIERLQGIPFAPAVPYAIIGSGQHEFLFEKDWNDIRGPDQILLAESVKKGTLYRVERKWGKLKLVVDTVYK